MSFQVVFNNTQNICHRCWQRIGVLAVAAAPAPDEQNVEEEQVQEPMVQNAPVLENAPMIENVQDLPYFYSPEHVRAPNAANRCVFNNCFNVERNRIPNTIKIYTLHTQRLYIPVEARACREHLEGNMWDNLLELCNVSHYFNVNYFTDMTNMLIEALNQESRMDFELLGSLSEADMHFWTGLNTEQFGSVLEETPSLRQAANRPRTVLGVYLSKLRTGESNERLSNLFNMSRRTLERKLASAREHLTADFVHTNLGMDHITRQNILDRNLFLARGIYGNDANTKSIIICDGTYVYIEKSSNFLFQRLSYSHHKFQNLLKPFLIVCSDGYIIDVLGPYAATTSDATIMNNLCADENHAFHWFFEPNDVFVLDRGFRDSILTLEAHGYEAHIPPTKDRNENQLTTEQANKSRLVTIIRWVVEAVNGKFKNRFKLLRQDYFNRALPHMFTDFKIAAALINAFYRVAVDNRLAEDFLRIINAKINTPNLLYDYVTLRNLNRQRVVFERIDAHLPQLDDFPVLTNDDLTKIALGSYQLKLARSYASEHLRNEGLYTIEIYRENNLPDLEQCNIFIDNNNAWLLRGRIQSRHIRQRTYYSYVLIDNNEQGVDAIKQYYCTCLSGRRTIGSCAHIISIIWFLGQGRLNGFNLPALHLDDIIVDL